VPLTAYPDVDALIGRVQARLHEILGGDLVGLYLFGSLVTGDFDLQVSDVDFVAVTRDALDPKQLDLLQGMHRTLAREHPAWDNRIEVAYPSTAALRTFRTRRSTMAVTSPGEPFHTKEAGIDWLINWYVLRENGVTLFGPPPTTLIDPISGGELASAVFERVAAWRASIGESRHRNGQVYATLTLCRALYTFTHGELASKPHSALWAAEQMPEWAPLIHEALRSWREDWYDDQVDHAATFAETVRFVVHVADRIERVAAARTSRTGAK
jgi:hypothetical protein